MSFPPSALARLAGALVLAAALILLAVLVWVSRGDARVVAGCVALVAAILQTAQAVLPSMLPALVARWTAPKPPGAP